MYLDEIISIADANSELDKGFGASAAWAWPYYSHDARRIATERINTKSEFARGFGFGLARVARQFSATERDMLIGRFSYDPFFAEGFAEGTGNYQWSVFDKQDKEGFLKQATQSAEIARGVGAGIGCNYYPFFKNELGHYQDPNLRRGLGIGIGRAYRYLPDDARAFALRMAEGDVEFATGLGQGIGMVYSYLDDAQKEFVLSHLGDTGFSKGLGIGFGLVLPYFADDLKKQILGYAAHNKQLSLGLGAALATRISYLSEQLAFSIFELAKNNSYLAAGLGEGCGTVFAKMSKSTSNKLSSWVGIDGFAFGFGIGIGRIRRYLQNDVFEQAAAFVNSNQFFAEGLAIGIGNSVAYISRELLFETLSKYPNENFARNFGFGFGHILTMLDDDKRKEVLEMMKGNGHFMMGLGEGVGHNLPITGSRIVEQTMQTLNSPDFAIGAASGVSEIFRHLGLAEAHGMIEYASTKADYGRILGRSLAEKFASFDEDLQSLILDAIQKDTGFSREFAKAIPRNLVYTSAQSQERIRRLLAELSHLSTEERAS